MNLISSLPLGPIGEKGTYEAIELLISQNHRQIGFISGYRIISLSKDCLQGYKRALADANINWKQRIIKERDWTFEGGFNAMTEIIREQPRLPSAIFACNDMIAIGVMEAIKAAGLSIPQDVSVIGCDDIDQSKYYSPKLTTIKVKTELMAKIACQNLFLAIESQEILNIQIILPTKLIVRESTTPCSIR